MNATDTLHAIILDARRRLERAGIEPAEAALDAELLARHALGGWERGQLLANWREPAPAGFVERFDPLVERRERREPTAYITGHREFWGLEIDVEPGVLIPRPETEFIIEEALARLTPLAESRPNGRVLRIADIGTGSGCLAIALARWLPSAHVIATDMSAAALAIAARNVVRHDVQDRVTLVRCDLLDATAGPFDLIVSNPPYVPAADLASLQPEILDYEPRLALEAGQDGLDLIRRLVPMAASRLVPGGWLVFEFGHGQATSVREIIAADARLAVVALRDDLAGIPRTAVACRTRSGL
ncbi:MAG: peptide chain release factor N(5)-glutamine methyltransferase [Acidobacteria bacterium]|nr:peptide chain release factor N(5)-glutamine methyltransferase [Acidobacteriota bacterium]